jgi:hypothetical protein
MKVEKFVEHEDGSASFELVATDEEKALLINAGFVALLKEVRERFDRYFERDNK